MSRLLFILFFALISLGVFSQNPGAVNDEFEVISKVYFGTLPFGDGDIMNPATGTNTLPCTGYSDYSLGNTNNGDGNLTGETYVMGVLRNENYNLEVDGGFCAAIPFVSNANRSFRIFVDFNADGDFLDANELVVTSPPYDSNFPSYQTLVSIPNDAALGPIKMRIVYNRVANNALWQFTNLFDWSEISYQYGETEDYTLVVTSYFESVTPTPATCINVADGEIEIVPSATAPSTLEYSINGSVGPWTSTLVYTGLPTGDYDVWARDVNLAPFYAYEQFEVTVGNPGPVVVNPVITSDYNGEAISCAGFSNGEITLSASGGNGGPYSYKYLDFTNMVITDVVTNPFVGLSEDTYSFIATDPFGCTSNPVDLILAEPEAISIEDVLITQQVSCADLCDAVLTIDADGGTPPYNYSVNGIDNGNNNEISNVCSGNPLVLLEDINNCAVQLNTFIQNPAEVSLSASVISDFSTFAISCQDSTDGVIELSASGGTSGEYSFSIDGGLTYPYSSSSIFDIDSLASGNYDIIARDSNLCQSTTQSLNLSSPPQLVSDFIITTSAISCNGFFDGEISMQGLNGVPPYTYSLDNGASTQSSTVFTNLGASSYDVLITDNNNCVHQETYLLDEPPLLNINSLDIVSDFNGSQLSCFGASDAVLSVDFSGGTAPYFYTLTSNPTVQTLSSSNLIPNLSSGAQTLLAIDDNGCFSSPVDFEIIEPELLEITSVDLISNVNCFGGSDGELLISASGGTSAYSYFVDALYTSSGQAPYTVSGLSPNSYNIVVTDENGCTSDPVNQLITQADQIIANLSIANLGCDQGSFGSASVDPIGGTPAFSYLWSTGSTSNSIDQLLAGGYSVVITDANGCQETLDFQITEPFIDLLVSPILCFGDGDGQIQSTLLNPNPSSVYSIFWNDDSAQTTATAVGLQAGNYTVTMIDQFGCELTATESIVEPDSLAVFVEHTQLCPNNPVASALVFTSGGLVPYDYDWSTNESTELINIDTPGSYTVMVTDFNGCQQDVGFTIDPISVVQLDFVIEEVSCKDNINGSVEVIPSGGYSPYSFEWSNFTSESINDGISSGIYGVTVIDNNNCSYFEEVELAPNNESCITAYSAFSPNGDQNNDYWHIDNIELYPDALVEVFNRWGDRVYSSKKYINAWEGAWQGMFDDSPLPSATYYYVITLNNDEEPLVGTVTIVR